MQRNFLLLLAAVLVTLVTLPADAQSRKPGAFRFGVGVGQVGLLGDPGSGGANAIGFAGQIGYLLEETVALDISYLRSSHSDVDHSSLNVGGDFYVGDYEAAYPHFTAGMSFINNKFKNIAIQGDAVGVYVGGGLDFELRPRLRLGPQLRFTKAFEAKANLNGKEIKTVQDSYSLLLRLVYTLGNDD